MNCSGTVSLNENGQYAGLEAVGLCNEEPMDSDQTAAMEKILEQLRIEELEDNERMLNRAVQLLFDAGPGHLPRFISVVPTDFDNIIQSSQLSPDSKVAVISVAGVDCPERTCFTLVLLRYLEYRSVIIDSGVAPSRNGFLAFLSQIPKVNVHSLQFVANRPGLHIWPRPFKFAEDVAVFVLCAVGAVSSDLRPDAGTTVLNASVLCSSVSFVHLGQEVGASCVDDCLHTIMISTDFLIYSNISMGTQIFPRLLLLNASDQAGGDCTSMTGPILARAATAIRHKQVDLFMSRAFPSGRFEQVRSPSIAADDARSVVADMQVDRLPSAYLSCVFDLCERGLGTRDTVPPFKIGLSGKSLTLGEFGAFVSQVCLVSCRRELIIKWSKRAMRVWAKKLCERQGSDGKNFRERDRQADLFAFSTHDRLKEMWDYNAVHPEEWDRLDHQFSELIRLWNTFDLIKEIKHLQQRAALLSKMDHMLVKMKHVTVAGQNASCQWLRRYCILRGDCGTAIRRSVAQVLQIIARGDITSTHQYIEIRNSLLDVSQLLTTSLTSSPDLCLMPQYLSLEFRIVSVISLCVIYTADAAWCQRVGGTFELIRCCTDSALMKFHNEYSSIVCNIAACRMDGAKLDRELNSFTDDVMDKWHTNIAMARFQVESGDLNEFDLIASDQMAGLRDYIQVRIMACRWFIQAGLSGSFLDPRKGKVFAIDQAAHLYLHSADQLAWCLRSIHVDL